MLDNHLSTLGNEDIQQIVTLVDGSYLPGIARMLWADFSICTAGHIHR